MVVQKRHNGPCAGEERLTDKDFFNGPLVKDRLSHQSFRFLQFKVDFYVEDGLKMMLNKYFQIMFQ